METPQPSSSSSQPQTYQIQLLPKQWQFYRANEFEVMYSGAFGAGKSRALCYKLLQHALIPGNFVALVRKTFTSLRHSTLRTLLKEESGLPPVLPEGTYTHNESKHSIQIHGGGEIFYFGLDKAQKYGSLNFGAVAVDEVVELSEDEYNMLAGRCRNTIDPNRQIFSATNPGSHLHFLYPRFFAASNNNRRVIQTTSLDNTFLPPDYTDFLQSLTGQTRSRYVEGRWGAFEGLIYEMFDPATHLVARPPEQMQRWYLGCDAGYTHPAVTVLAGVDGDGRIHVYRVWSKRKALQDEHVAETVSLWKSQRCSGCCVDPSAAGLRAALELRGVKCIDTDNDVFNGIRAVQAALNVAGDRKPRLTFEPHPSLDPLIMELGSYRWAKSKGENAKEKDAPVKEFDDCLDATRYIVYSLTKDAHYTPAPVPDKRNVFSSKNYQRGRLRF